MNHSPQRMKILFIYLGRHGALADLVAALAEAATTSGDITAHFLVAANGAAEKRLAGSGVPMQTLATFDRADPLSLTRGFFRARRALRLQLLADKPDAVINLMPHIWTPLLGAMIRRLGIAYIPIIHDAVPHPGDPTARLTRWLVRDAHNATRVITLSQSVAQELYARGDADPVHTATLFHPDIGRSVAHSGGTRSPNEPFRVLFFGRIMAYKGLDVLVGAAENLKARGAGIALGVAGAGDIPDDLRKRLAALHAEVENTWIADADVPGWMTRYDALACPHVEASQSGIVPLAFGYGLPVIAMPTGGLSEQVLDGETGVVAKAPTIPAFADAIERLGHDPQLYSRIAANINASRDARSPARFISLVAAEARRAVKRI